MLEKISMSYHLDWSTACITTAENLQNNTDYLIHHCIESPDTLEGYDLNDFHWGI